MGNASGRSRNWPSTRLPLKDSSGSPLSSKSQIPPPADCRHARAYNSNANSCANNAATSQPPDTWTCHSPSSDRKRKPEPSPFNQTQDSNVALPGSGVEKITASFRVKQFLSLSKRSILFVHLPSPINFVPSPVPAIIPHALCRGSNIRCFVSKLFVKKGM